MLELRRWRQVCSTWSHKASQIHRHAHCVRCACLEGKRVSMPFLSLLEMSSATLINGSILNGIKVFHQQTLSNVQRGRVPYLVDNVRMCKTLMPLSIDPSSVVPSASSKTQKGIENDMAMASARSGGLELDKPLYLATGERRRGLYDVHEANRLRSHRLATASPPLATR